MNMAVYVIAHITVEDPDAYGEYQRLGLPTITAAGGRVIAGGAGITLEGDEMPNGSAIVEFPTMEAALGWYHGDEYQSAIPMRVEVSKALMIGILPGVVAHGQ
jgi:uncharacterized protein (DUF1330 family)